MMLEEINAAKEATSMCQSTESGVPSFQAGKITRVQQWLAGLGHRFEDFAVTTCYSDSTNDLPLLEAVSHPVATNPSATLEALARERGWPVLKLFE